MARDAWYSKNPPTKQVGLRYYRKHPNENRYFWLSELGSGHYVATVCEHKDGREPDVEVTICGYDYSNHWVFNSDREMLNKIPVTGTDVGRNESIFGENFTIGKGDVYPFFLHRCFDGTVKELRLSPDPIVSGNPCTRRLLAVKVSETSQLFKGEEHQVAARMLQGFLNNRNVNQGLAFDHLEALAQLQAHNLENLPSKMETRKTPFRTPRKWFEYAPGSGYYFRKISDDEIQQYDPNPRKRETFIRPHTLSSASLTHRKMRIYGFTRGGETQAI
ncbi:hypothetical protein JCM3765_000924 [Sporobolomyces pararoseus]